MSTNLFSIDIFLIEGVRLIMIIIRDAIFSIQLLLNLVSSFYGDI